MFSSIGKLPHPIPKADKPGPKAAQALQEGLGGQFSPGLDAELKKLTQQLQRHQKTRRV